MKYLYFAWLEHEHRGRMRQRLALSFYRGECAHSIFFGGIGREGKRSRHQDCSSRGRELKRGKEKNLWGNYSS